MAIFNSGIASLISSITNPPISTNFKIMLIPSPTPSTTTRGKNSHLPEGKKNKPKDTLNLKILTSIKVLEERNLKILLRDCDWPKPRTGTIPKHKTTNKYPPPNNSTTKISTLPGTTPSAEVTSLAPSKPWATAPHKPSTSQST